jgi:hypothetical protein
VVSISVVGAVFIEVVSNGTDVVDSAEIKYGRYVNFWALKL